MKELIDRHYAESLVSATILVVASIVLLHSVRSKIETSERKAAVDYSTLKRVYAAKAWREFAGPD
jgi:hypothetical protein